ncbi:hypothetical protein [Aureivirga sp. CE67]|uniref:hypothetical protein n=1 Tax=Aureivirga sp. CE67 TaxID=1788983 RepID=UPI0018CB444B|nr:hypothetical protein [Aureivirga sp. CE67]
MEHLSIYCELSLIEFCNKLKNIMNISEFMFNMENETEWGESDNEFIKINVSRPFKVGMLQEWDSTVPAKCNFGITILDGIKDVEEIKNICQLIANEFNSSIYYHRSWVSPGVNIKRNIQIQPY